MADISYEERNRIDAILSESSRLTFVLIDKYKVQPSEITSIRVDSDNFKIDVRVGEEVLRFKAKGTDSVIMKDPEAGILKLTFDPALAQGVYNIVDEFA
jgi:hypothetical protein